jgi:hypothetical protein
MAKARRPAANAVAPELGAFLVCENVLEEPDRVTSAIRIVDQISIQPAEFPARGTLMRLPVWLMLLLKTGKARGPRQIRFFLENPSGGRDQIAEMTLSFTGPPEGGHNVRMRLIVKWDQEGLYWLSATLSGKHLASTPLWIGTENSTKRRRK